MADKTLKRIDRVGEHNTAFLKNRKKVMAMYDVCYLCGQLVDKNLPPGTPLSPEVDHIIPINKGGHPSSLSNLMLTHRACNRRKSDHLVGIGKAEQIGNSALNWALDWTEYRS